MKRLFSCNQSNLVAGNRQKVRHIWNFSIVQWIRYRPSLWAWAGRSVYGAASICWRDTGPTTPPAMLMYGKEASNRKQEIDRTSIPNQRPKISIVGKSKLLDFPTMPTSGIPPTPYIFLYTLNLYLVKCRQHHGSAFGWTIPTKHHSRQQKTF